MKLSIKCRIWLVAMIMIPLAFPLAATEGAAHHFDWGQLIAKVLNSALLFGTLFLFLRKPIQDLLRKNGQFLITSFDERQKELVAARDQVAQLQQRVEELKAEIAVIVKEAELNGQTERDRMLETARIEAQRLHSFATDEIQKRVDAAVRHLRQELADAAITQVRQELKESLGPEGQDRIIDKNIDLCGEILEH